MMHGPINIRILWSLSGVKRSGRKIEKNVEVKE